MGTSPSTRAALLALALALPGGARHAGAQAATSLPVKALELEQAGKWREAIVAYRASLNEQQLIPVVLGLERVYSQIGQTDSLLPLLDSLIGTHPRDAQLRTIQLRTLAWMGRDAQADRAFERWLVASPRDPLPYREYARLLLSDGKSARADSVLQRGQRALGGGRDFPVELAQLRAALGMWAESAAGWREALVAVPYMEQAAVFSLIPAPDSAREGVRAALRAPPATVSSRRVLASLEMRWRSPREGWLALRELAPDDSALAAWSDFATEAEEQQAWLTARDALAAVVEKRPSAVLAARAAGNALTGGDPASALALLAPWANATDPETVDLVLPPRVSALSALGKVADAEAAVAARGAALSAPARARLARTLALGWIRVGDLPRAKAAFEQSGGGEDDRIGGWIALYEGDLGAARRGLRRALESSPDMLLAQSLLARTTATESPAVGRAFLTLAQGDSAGAVAAFRQAADSLPDAAPLLLGVAARLAATRGDGATSLALWQRLVEQHASSPEAAEAELAWARALRRSGDAAGAIARLEHLILTWPTSALVPQARRELELARGAVPPASR